MKRQQRDPFIPNKGTLSYKAKANAAATGESVFLKHTFEGFDFIQFFISGKGRRRKAVMSSWRVHQNSC